jgi:Tfp pilus assembly protein PilP
MKKIKFAIASTFIIIFIIAIFIIAIFAFAAEVKNTLPLIPPVNVVPATLQTQIQQPPPLAPTPDNTYSYNPLGKPDPFRPFVEVDIVVKKDEITSIFPLQRVETENFRVVGIGGDNIRRVAVVEDTAKKFYPLFKGTHIGLYNGKVIEIMRDHVIVEEYESKKAKRIILKLRKN